MFNTLIELGFFPNPEFIAFEPIFISNLAKFSSILPPVCAFLLFPWFLYFLTIILTTLFGVDGANLSFFFLIHVFLGPIGLVCLIVTFEGKFFLLTLSYLTMNAVLFVLNPFLYRLFSSHSSMSCSL